MSSRLPIRALSAAAALVLVAVLLAYAGPGSVAAALAEARMGYVLLAFLAYASFFVVRGIRWQRLLADRRTSARTLAAVTAMGWAVSTYVPFKAGDLTRSALVARERREPFSEVVGTVALERVLDVFGLAAAATVGLGLAAFVDRGSVSGLAAEAVAVAWVLPLAGLVGLLALSRVLRPRPGRNLLLAFLGRLLEGTRRLRSRPRAIPPLVLLTLLSTGSLVSMFTCLVLALRPEVPLTVAVSGVTLFLLSFVVAITPGHVGTYEAAFVGVFALFGVSGELLATALAVHVLTVGIVTVLGGLGFVLHRLARPAAHATPVPAEATS